MHLSAQRCVAAVIGFQLIAWTLVPWLVNVSLPLDMVREGLSWGNEFQLGYYKHPPLPSWLAEVSFRLLGDIGPYLLSQLFIALTYLFVFLLGRRLMPEWKAAAGTVGLIGVSFFTWSSVEFNHNVAQMPLWVAAIYLLHTLVEKPALWRWLLLAVISAAGIYSKYSFVVLIGLGFLFLLQAPYRHLLTSRGFWAFVLLLFALLTPHILWLQANDYLPFQYLEKRAEDAANFSERLLDPVLFIVVQSVNVLVLIVLMLWLGLGRTATTSPAFLRWFALAPLLFVALLSLIMAEEPRAMWATPMLSLVGLMLAWHLPGSAMLRLGKLTLIALTISALVLCAYAAKALWGEANSGKASRTGWPDSALAAQAQTLWATSVGNKPECPLRIVSGDNWLAGLVAYRHPTRPSVLVDGDFRLSTWLTSDLADEQGILLIWQEKHQPPALSAELATDALAPQRMEFSWPRAPSLESLVVMMQVVLPSNSACAPAQLPPPSPPVESATQD